MKKNKPGAGRPIFTNHPWSDLAKSVGGSFKLAEKLGVSQATLNRWYRGESRVPAMAMKEVERLCKYYSIELDTKSLTKSTKNQPQMQSED